MVRTVILVKHLLARPTLLVFVLIYLLSDMHPPVGKPPQASMVVGWIKYTKLATDKAAIPAIHIRPTAKVANKCRSLPANVQSLRGG